MVETLACVRDHDAAQTKRGKSLDVTLVTTDTGIWLKGTKAQVQGPTLCMCSLAE